MYRKIFISFLLAVGILAGSIAQVDRRTRETKIADIVMQLPADHTAGYNNLMDELSKVSDPISYLAPLLSDPGGNDAQIRYAIGGLAMYASKSESLKAPVAKGICTAIPKAKSDEIRDFLFIQLQYVAGAESVETAAQYLNNDRLCDAAARVLVRIGNDAAGKALLSALPNAKVDNRTSLVEALGDMAYQPAAGAIAGLAGTTEPGLRKAALYSLAKIASPSAEKILQTAAEKAGYRYEPADALGSYVLFLENRLPGHAASVGKISKKMLKAVSDHSQIAARSAFLELYVLSSGEKAIKEIIPVLGSNSKQYREAALKYSAHITSPKMYDALMKKAKSESRPEVQAEIVAAFGERNDKQAFSFVQECLSSPNTSLRSEAIVTAGKLGGEAATGMIIKAMNTNDEKVVETGKSTLLSLKSDKLVSGIASAIPQTTVAAKVAFLEILAARKAESQIETVYAQTASTDTKTRLAANKALASMASEKDVPRIAQLLNAATDNQEKQALQQALYVAVSSLSQDRQTKLVTDQMNAGNKRASYYNVLAMIGGKEALEIVQNGFKSSNADSKADALDALANWNDASAIPSLFNIAKSDPAGSYFDRALTAYISKVSSSGNTPEQKLLLLRDALDIAGSPGQKQDILRYIGQTGTFVGLLIAGDYLDNATEAVRQAAVQAVRTIALAHPEYYGKMVTDIINKAIAVNKDPEAGYQKQALIEHMATLPKDEGFVSMFNGKDLTGWKGLVEDPIKRSKMTPKELAVKQKKADEIMRRDWYVKDGLLIFDGKGNDNLCSEKMYGDFEMYVDWRIAPKGDAGIYLRGSPQVQIWDVTSGSLETQVGSGGLFNNKKHADKPLVVADNPVNEWNSFYIKMIGEKVTVYLNGQLVTDNIILENYWDRSIPIFPKESVELQAHASRVEYRDIYICDLPPREHANE